MDSYTINFVASAERELQKLDAQFVQRIANAIDSLAQVPRPSGCRKLKGSLHTYRIRVSDYRVISKIDDGNREVTVQRVRLRKDAYK